MLCVFSITFDFLLFIQIDISLSFVVMIFSVVDSHLLFCYLFSMSFFRMFFYFSLFLILAPPLCSTFPSYAFFLSSFVGFSLFVALSFLLALFHLLESFARTFLRTSAGCSKISGV